MTTTAFAAETSGSSDGAGTFEGHANSTIVSVTLPTVSESSTAFNYIYDPEGLIEGTSNAAYEDATFTGDYVYFESAKDKYTAESKTLTVSNNSMVSINVTVKVGLVAGTSDPALVSSDTVAKAAKDPSLYLGLKVGDKPAKAIMNDDVEVTVSLNGMPDNYTLSYNGTPHSYSYKVKKDASGWESVGFSVVGAANKVTNAKDKTAPTLKVTWKYETVGEVEQEGNPTSTPTETPAADKAPSVAKDTYSKSELSGDSGQATFTVDYGTGSLAGTAITKVWFSADGTTFKAFSSTNTPAIDNTNNCFKINKTYFRDMSAKRYIRAYFDNSESKYVTITVNP